MSVPLSWISKVLPTNLGENTHRSRTEMERACISFEERTGLNSLIGQQGFKRVLREKFLGYQLYKSLYSWSEVVSMVL